MATPFSNVSETDSHSVESGLWLSSNVVNFVRTTKNNDPEILSPTEAFCSEMQGAYRMTHFILQGKPFDKAVKTLITQGYDITWGYISNRLRRELTKTGKSKTQQKLKVKYACPVCRQACWGSPKLDLICGKHHEKLIPAKPNSHGEKT